MRALRTPSALSALGLMALLGFGACSGKSKASADGGSARSQRLEEARRSAEEAERKAHELRMEKSRQGGT